VKGGTKNHHALLLDSFARLREGASIARGGEGNASREYNHQGTSCAARRRKGTGEIRGLTLPKSSNLGGGENQGDPERRKRISRVLTRHP